MGGASPPPVVQRLDEIVENTAWSSEPIFDWLGVKFRVLCALRNVFAHDVEHVVDPRTGHEVLVMASPHTYRGVRIYDLKEREVVWEYQVPGSAVDNPHCAHMVMFDAEPHNAREGDVITADRDNRLIIVDRDTKEIRKAITPPEVSWLHETLLTAPNTSIITDYGRQTISKMNEWGEFLWDTGPLGGGVAKANPIPGAMHTASFGGHYVVAINREWGFVVEIDDNDGSEVWRKPGGEVDYGMSLPKPHSAFRMGGVECRGNPTVVGLEAGGGIVAIDYHGRPLWGFLGGIVAGDYELYYQPPPHFLLEVTDVFPTLDGHVGFAAQAGYGCTIVGELLGVPRRRRMAWTLVKDHLTGDGWEEPAAPICASGWEETTILALNTGDHPADLRVEGVPDHHAAKNLLNAGYRRTLFDGSVAPGEEVELTDQKYPFLRVMWRSSTAGQPAKLTVYVLQR